MNCINLIIDNKPVQLIIHDDGHEGPSFDVMAVVGRGKTVRFGRFKQLGHAQLYREKYALYYRHVKFFISKSFL